MIPPVFTILNASSAVKALLGTSPLRVFPWGEAPEGSAKPYATYIVFNATPENTLGEVPEDDMMHTQIDVWGETLSSCITVAEAIRDALEPYGHMVAFSAMPPDTETKLYRQRMDFDFITDR